ncbi:MAG: LicD family protein [Nocardioidaceae bacterium]|nr:LicD family protein [Nocardioidaceae bacterium]MCL2613080.1 LicD family protein [Nocardioidaceae bacterium]
MTRIRIEQDGIALSGELLAAYDLVVEGRRVWSFRPATAGERRETESDVSEWWVPWPQRLSRFLCGTGDIEVRTPAGETCAAAEIRFDDTEGRVAVADEQGRPLILDSKGRVTRPFDEDAESAEGLLAATRAVLDVMSEAGFQAFLAYGTLLGAVREGGFIGHDNDVDIGYVSELSSPVEVVRESLHLQRVLTQAGMGVERYSGAGFQVHVRGEDGGLRGLDVFGGYWDRGRLALLGEIHTPFEREWITPLTTVEMAGHVFPAPAAPERMLEAMYGPGWKVPDPTFVFDSSWGREYLSRWFRGIRAGRNQWNARYSGALHRRPPVVQHAVAELVHELEHPGATVIDVGCGRGQDAAYLAEQGHPAIALDFAPRGAALNLERAQEAGWPMEFHTVNLLELRQSLAWGARLSREIEGPRAVLARHVVDATSRRGREGLFRLSSMALRAGGRLYLEFFAAVDEEAPRRTEDALVEEIVPDRLRAEIETYGGTVADVSYSEPGRRELYAETVEWHPPPRVCRMVVRWSGAT